MKILVQPLPNSKLELAEVNGPDFKRVPLRIGGYRLRSSVWFVDYSQVTEDEKEVLAGKAQLINDKLKQIDELRREVTDLKRELKETYCRTEKDKEQ